MIMPKTRTMRIQTLFLAVVATQSAQADIYFCEALQYAESMLGNTITISDKLFDSDMYDRDTYSVIVDTEKGTSEPDIRDYQGSCTQDEEFVKCENERFGDTYQRIVINKKERAYSEIYQNYSSLTGYSVSGKCVKA